MRPSLAGAGWCLPPSSQTSCWRTRGLACMGASTSGLTGDLWQLVPALLSVRLPGALLPGTPSSPKLHYLAFSCTHAQSQLEAGVQLCLLVAPDLRFWLISTPCAEGALGIAVGRAMRARCRAERGGLVTNRSRSSSRGRLLQC